MTDRFWTAPLDKRTETGWYGCDAPIGWKDIILKADRMLEHIDPNYTIHQVKEKYGTLRYYFGTTKSGIEADIMEAIARNAEADSRHSCQECGKYGELRGRTWFNTLCDEHYNEPITGDKK
jgi:hypothetical protein